MIKTIVKKIKKLFGYKENRRYNWKKQKHDPRDHHFSTRVSALPLKVNQRGYCGPVVDQGDVGSCHDIETEVLTISGWKLFKDVSMDDKLASVDPITKDTIFEYPKKLIRFNYNGPMYYSDHKHLDFAITPDHKMLVRKWDESQRTLSKDYQLIEMKDVGWYSGLLNSVEYSGGEKCEFYTLPGVEHKHISSSQREDKKIPMQTWMKFLGIYLAEGTILKEEYKIQIAAVKEREKSFIREVLNEMNQHYLELEDRFTIINKQLYLALQSLGLKGVKAPFKFVPEFVFKLDKESMKNLLLGHFMGDGCEQDGRIKHYTSSKQLSDDLQRLVFLTGGWASAGSREPRTSTTKDGRIIKGNYPEYNVSRWNEGHLSLEKKNQTIIKEYNGEVFCAEVPSYHTLVTRRNGKMLISGNCTGNSLANAFGFLELRELRLKITGPEIFNPKKYLPASRLFIYYNERVIEGTVNEDAGAEIRDGIKTLNKQGVCTEVTWPYKTSNVFKRPSTSAYNEAKLHKITSYQALHTIDDMKHCLASGYPFVFGFEVFESFESDAVAATGIMPMPQPSEENVGGHAVMCVGYDDTHNWFIVMNSWGTSWGDKGYFYMSYDYMDQYSDDIWVIKL